MKMLQVIDEDASSHSHNKKILRPKPKRLERSKRDSIRFRIHRPGLVACCFCIMHARWRDRLLDMNNKRPPPPRSFDWLTDRASRMSHGLRGKMRMLCLKRTKRRDGLAVAVAAVVVVVDDDDAFDDETDI
jgi:hypothetical protein